MQIRTMYAVYEVVDASRYGNVIHATRYDGTIIKFVCKTIGYASDVIDQLYRKARTEISIIDHIEYDPDDYDMLWSDDMCSMKNGNKATENFVMVRNRLYNESRGRSKAYRLAYEKKMSFYIEHSMDEAIEILKKDAGEWYE